MLHLFVLQAYVVADRAFAIAVSHAKGTANRPSCRQGNANEPVDVASHHGTWRETSQ